MLAEVLHLRIFPDLEELATNISEDIRSVQPCECETKSLHDQSVMIPLLIIPRNKHACIFCMNGGDPVEIVVVVVVVVVVTIEVV